MSLNSNTSNSNKKEKKIEKFWQWFAENESVLYKFEKNQEAIFTTLTGILRTIHPSLGFAFSEITSNNMREFILCTNGDKSAIPIIEHLHASAPSMANWTITKFRPRMNVRDCLVPFAIADKTFYPDKVTFTLFTKKNKIYLAFFIEGLDENNKDPYLVQGMSVLLDHLLGEYDAMTKIDHVWLEPSHKSIGKGKKYQLKYLPQAFDKILSRIQFGPGKKT